MLIDHVMARCHKLSERLIRWFWFYNYSTTHLWYNTVWVTGPKTVLHIGYETDDVHNIAFLNDVIHMVLIVHKNIRNMQCDVTVYRLLNGLLRQDNTNCIQQKLYQKTIWNWRICTLISFWITSVSSLIFLQNLIKILLDWRECH